MGSALQHTSLPQALCGCVLESLRRAACSTRLTQVAPDAKRAWLQVLVMHGRGQGRCPLHRHWGRLCLDQSAADYTARQQGSEDLPPIPNSSLSVSQMQSRPHGPQPRLVTASMPDT